MDEDILNLLQEAPENIEDIQSVEETVSELERVYSEIKEALEKEEKEKVEKLKRRLIKPLVALIKAGYSEYTLRRVMRTIGFKEKDINEFLTEAWKQIEEEEHHTKLIKTIKFVSVGIILVLLGVAYLMLFSTTRPETCQSFACSGEILNCTPGKYYNEDGGINRYITIQKDGNLCLVSVRVVKATNKTLIGKYLNCRFQIIDGLTDLSDTSYCSGTLDTRTLFAIN